MSRAASRERRRAKPASAALLGLLRENEGVAARILLDFDADAEKVRAEVERALGQPIPVPSNPAAGAPRSPPPRACRPLSRLAFAPGVVVGWTIWG